jgi:hypothetical protein
LLPNGMVPTSTKKSMVSTKVTCSNNRVDRGDNRAWLCMGYDIKDLICEFEWGELRYEDCTDLFLSEEAWTNGVREFVYEFALKKDMGDFYKYYNEENGSLPSLDVPRTYDESLLKKTSDCDYYKVLSIPCGMLTIDEYPNVARIQFDPCKPERSTCEFSEGWNSYESCQDLLDSKDAWHNGLRDVTFNFDVFNDAREVFQYYDDKHGPPPKPYDVNLLGQSDGCLWDCQSFVCDELFHSDLQLCPE